jgi:glycosyltransferase involved in cell wall biosynthesis
MPIRRKLRTLLLSVAGPATNQDNFADISTENATDTPSEIASQLCNRYSLNHLSSQQILRSLRALTRGGWLWLLSEHQLTNQETNGGRPFLLHTRPRLTRILESLNDPTRASTVFCPLLDVASKTQLPAGLGQGGHSTSIATPSVLRHLDLAAAGQEPDGLLFISYHVARQLRHWHQLPEQESLLTRFARLDPHFQVLISPHPCFDGQHYLNQRRQLDHVSAPGPYHPLLDYLRNCQRSARFRYLEPVASFNPSLWDVRKAQNHQAHTAVLQAPLISYLTTMANANDSCPISFPRLAGRVDGLDQQGLLRGWCHSPENGSPIELEVWLAGVRLGAGFAREDRPDVASRGLAMRECGFAIPLDLEALPLDLLPELKGERWRIVSTDHRYSLGRGDWRLTPEDCGVVIEQLLLRSLAANSLDGVTAWLGRESNQALVGLARYRMVEWAVISAMAGSWHTSAVEQAQRATDRNAAMLHGVEAESCQRTELSLLALAHLHRCWDHDQIQPTASPPSADLAAHSLALSHQLAERCYFGPTPQERHCWDSQLRPLFNVVIATLLLQQEAPDLTPTRSLLATLVRLCQEVFGDLQLATTLQHLLDSNSPSIAPDALRLQLRSGDALGVAISHLHQRRAGLEPSLKPFDQALALLEVSKQSLCTIEAALSRLLPLIPDQQARSPRSSFCRRLLDQLGWHVNTLSSDLIDQLIDRGLPKHLGMAVRDRSIHILSRISQALWCGDHGHSGCTALPPSHQQPLRWLLIGEQALPQCWLYRVEQKRQQLERCGAEVRCIDRGELDAWGFSQQVAWADAVLFCRTPATYGVIRALTFARHLGKRVLADVDDLVFSTHFPAPYITYGGSINRSIHRRLQLDAPLQRWPLEQADHVITSTAALVDACRETSDLLASKPITVLPNLPLPELLGLARRLAHQPPQRSPRLVVSSGTLAHKQIWAEQLAPAIAQLLSNHPQLRLSLLGHLELPTCLQPFSARIGTVPYSDYGHYLLQLAEATIALVPLESHPTTHCKSAIKWMEASLLGLASVCSPVRAYTDAASPEEHLLLADDQQAWVQHVERLLNDPILLSRLSSQARQHAQSLFHEHLGEQFWSEHFLSSNPNNNSNDNQTPTPAISRQKLLVINVFFAPQSIGGATRVAQDQVREILQDHADAYDVTVLCIDHDPWQDLTSETLPLDIWHWQGARIVRLAVPPRSWADIQDGRVESFCRQWFQDESFDLIHCHCCQVLTASPLVVARQLGIPYIVTLHDAWWLSPELFLVSPAGRPIDPAKPFDHIDGIPTPEEKAIALERRSILAGILQGARQRLAVSDPFRKVYERAGVGNIDVRENKFTPMPPPKPRPPRGPNDPLRICHVGGMAMHKGYHILRQAVHLLPNNLNLEVTVIDHHLQEDDPPYSAYWSGYPVKFVPPVPMAKMASFYSSQDLLVAPSIWPESFGLVTREALDASLFTIASKIGALSEPIKEDVNGYAIKPNSPEDLTSSLVKAHKMFFNRPA